MQVFVVIFRYIWEFIWWGLGFLNIVLGLDGSSLLTSPQGSDDFLLLRWIGGSKQDTCPMQMLSNIGH